MLSLDQVLIYGLPLDSSESLQRCPDLKDFQCPFLPLLEAVKPLFTTCFCILVLAVSCLLLLLKVFHPLDGSCVISFLEQQHLVVLVPSLCSRSCGSAGFSLAMALETCCPSAPTSGWGGAPLRFLSYMAFCSLVLIPHV